MDLCIEVKLWGFRYTWNTETERDVLGDCESNLDEK